MYTLLILIVLKFCLTRGGCRISGKGVHIYQGMGGSLCGFNLIFLKYPMKLK